MNIPAAPIPKKTVVLITRRAADSARPDSPRSANEVISGTSSEVNAPMTAYGNMTTGSAIEWSMPYDESASDELFPNLRSPHGTAACSSMTRP